MLPFVAGMFFIALGVYVLMYSTDQNLRSKDGGWEITYTTNQTGARLGDHVHHQPNGRADDGGESSQRGHHESHGDF